MNLDSVLFLIQKYGEGDVLTEYSQKIASYLSERNVRTDLICFGGEERTEERGNLTVHEFSFKLHGDNYFSWSMLIQTEFLRKVREVLEERQKSIIHANDWLTVPAGMVASKLFEVPLVITYHSIEEEQGMHNPHSGHISEIERQGIEEASYIIVHKNETRRALNVYDLPEGKVKLFEGDDWEEKVSKIYQEVARVSATRENLQKKVDKNESFDAYVGVPSA